MREKILRMAKRVFGKDRFEELMGELWLQAPSLAARVRRGAPLSVVLMEWEARFRRDVEEGRYQWRGRRHRVARMSEIESSIAETARTSLEQVPGFDIIQPKVRRKF